MIKSVKLVDGTVIAPKDKEFLILESEKIIFVDPEHDRVTIFPRHAIMAIYIESRALAKEYEDKYKRARRSQGYKRASELRKGGER